MEDLVLMVQWLVKWMMLHWMFKELNVINIYMTDFTTADLTYSFEVFPLQRTINAELYDICYIKIHLRIIATDYLPWYFKNEEQKVCWHA